MHASRLLFAALSFWLALTVIGCRKDAGTESEPGSAAPKTNELPPLAVKADTPNLLLTWIDEQGEFHVVQKPLDVPVTARKQVRIVVADRRDGTEDRVYVADLNETTPDGHYRVKTMSRSAWDELGAGRRKARLEALAPPTGSAPPPLPTGSAQANAALVVIIYGADWCKPCHDAERYLKRQGVSVVMKDIEQNEAAAREMQQKLARAGRAGASIPVIDVVGRILVGFSPSSLDQALEAARSAKPL